MCAASVSLRSLPTSNASSRTALLFSLFKREIAKRSVIFGYPTLYLYGSKESLIIGARRVKPQSQCRAQLLQKFSVASVSGTSRKVKNARFAFDARKWRQFEMLRPCRQQRLRFAVIIAEQNRIRRRKPALQRKLADYPRRFQLLFQKAPVRIIAQGVARQMNTRAQLRQRESANPAASADALRFAFDDAHIRI